MRESRGQQDSGSVEPLGEIPCDISSAAFWAGAAMLVPGSEVTIHNLLLNPLRIGWISVLQRAGADITTQIEQEVAGEPVGSVTLRHSHLHPLRISPDEVPCVIDEIPVLSVIAAIADGPSCFGRVSLSCVSKESDRLTAIADNLSAMNARSMISGDTLTIEGNAELRGFSIDPLGDHRIAMAFACAGLSADGETIIENSDCASVSYPEFWSELSRLSGLKIA